MNFPPRSASPIFRQKYISPIVGIMILSPLRIAFLVLTPFALFAQDSVDVTFYYKPSGNPSMVYLPGEFNNWASNSGGVINPNPLWNMTKDANGVWYKTLRLRVGGHIGGRVAGAYQYKFNENGSANGWLSDPMNPRTNPNDYNNSILYIGNPTIYQLLPLPNTNVKSNQPSITAYIFPSIASSIDTTKLQVFINGIAYDAGRFYNRTTQRLSIQTPPLADGDHTARVHAQTSNGQNTSDSTRFTIQAAIVQLLTRNNDNVRVGEKTISGIVLDTSITQVFLVRNESDTIRTNVIAGAFSQAMQLRDGLNSFKAISMKDSIPRVSQSIQLRYKKDHTPKPIIMMGSPGSTITLNAFASTDPDGDKMSYRWKSEDEKNPVALNVEASGEVISFDRPSTPGEYFFRLEARDSSGNIGIARNYFTVSPDSSVELGTVNSNPAWVRDAIVYEIFVPAFSPNGTIDAITQRISSLKDLGVNTLWLMPVMDNLGSINENNGGYDIVDFFSIEPKLGNLTNFKRLIDSAHANKMRVILDITPNHVSQQHLWVNDIRQWGDYSNFRRFIETRILGDDRGLGQSLTSYQGKPLYAHYDGWGLANLNLSDEECRLAMMDVFKFWLIDQNVDGFRMDVYWGPHTRYGKQAFWRPFREEMKRIKPEMFILGETDGTGFGSENNYADVGGASDAAYDWNLFGQIKNALNTGNVETLHQRIMNYSQSDIYNFHTGPNAHYFRFIENHDETRIAQEFRFDPQRTKAAAALLMAAPGIPMLYAGQEIGWTGRRDLIDFTSATAKNFFPFYQRVTRLRGMFRAFQTPKLRRITSNQSQMYAFVRPFRNQNILATISFSTVPIIANLQLNESDLDLAPPIEPNRTYFLNNLINDSSYAVQGSQISAFAVSLQPFESKIFLLSDTAFKVKITDVHPEEKKLSRDFMLSNVYPNPWSESASFEVHDGLKNGSPGKQTTLKIFDVLGREVCDLSDRLRTQNPIVMLHDSMIPRSGIYFVRMSGQGFSFVKKFSFIKSS